MSAKPFSQACENNKQPILERIAPLYPAQQTVLEIGSGTGQHACYFAQQLPELLWQPSDRAEQLPGMQLWLDAAQLPNILPPLVLDVAQTPWPVRGIAGLFTANTLHIMAWTEIVVLFQQLQHCLLSGGYCCIYGPFNYGGSYTSPSNAHFDQWLQQRNPLSAIRDVEKISDLAQQADMTLVQDYAMPANNRLLVWQKR